MTQSHRRGTGAQAPLTERTLSRRALLASAGGLALTSLLARSAPAFAFGEESAFDPRALLIGKARWQGPRAGALARWSAELIARTSAPARAAPVAVPAGDPALLSGPFVVWAGDADPGALSDAERVGLQRFLALGGTLFVDDFEPSSAAFTRGVRRELGRVVPEALPVRLSDKSVLWKSFYLLSRPYGRVEGPSSIDAVLRGGLPQILFSSHDLLGALASGPGSGLRVEPGGETQRERAVRFAVNIAMFVLCSNYKDDQVHAPFLMRRRKPESP